VFSKIALCFRALLGELVRDFALATVLLHPLFSLGDLDCPREDLGEVGTQNSRDERQVGSGEAFDFSVVDDGVECVFLPIVTASIDALLAD
jgi:hypothetical protein